MFMPFAPGVGLLLGTGARRRTHDYVCTGHHFPDGCGNFLAAVASLTSTGKMSVQVEHQLDPSSKPHPTLIAIQANQLALMDSKRPELGWKLVRDEPRRDQT
jgi:hypothetical protein